jgi:signal transduction histidine kinase/CheY-like chemotaxis protein/streptogramin lyase
LTVVRAGIFGICMTLLGLASTPVLAQVPATPVPRQLSVADGLPSSNINGFAEDHFGYLWMASRDGLARYDGRGYRLWRVEDGLRDNLVWSVHVDARNQLWIGTQNAGLAMLSADRRNFRFYDQATHPGMGSNAIWAITSTPDGSVWFGTATGGLHRLGPDGAIRRFMPEPGNPRSLPSAAVGYLAVTGDGSLWAGTRNGLARWTGGDFERVGDDVLPSPTINGLNVDRLGRMWIATMGGVVMRDSGGQFHRHTWAGESAGSVLSMLFHGVDGSYWLDTRTGLGHVWKGTLRNVPLYSVQERGLVRPNWSVAHEDREGGLWFASTNAGLWRLPASWQQFSVLSRRLDEPQSLRNPYALALASSRNGGIWVVGTRGALDRVNPATGEVEHHLAPIDGTRWAQSVAEDANGRVWMGSRDALIRYDPESRQAQRWYQHDAVDAAMPGDGEILRTCANGTMWMYSEIGGIQQRDLQGRVLRHIARGAHGLPASTAVEEMRCGPKDQLWLATAAGMLQWDPVQDRFNPVPGGPTSHVYTFRVTGDGVAWLVGMGKIEQYLWNGHSLQLLDTIGAERDYPALAAGSVLIDHDGVAWASSARGLIRIDPGSRAIRLYGVHDGLPGQEFRRRALVQASSGQIAGGTPEGLVLFDPKMVKPSSRRPPLVVERVDVRRGDHIEDLTYATPLEVDEDDRDLRIVARLLSFADSSTNIYRFRLGGYDTDWVEVDAAGERVFSRLPSGRYVLEIQARNADNMWSQVETLSFHVLPPWWRSVGGIVALSSVLAIVLGVVVYLYRRRLRRRNEWQLTVHKRELAEQASLAKTRFLATLGHELRTPMTGVLGMSELLLASELSTKQRGYTDAIRRAGHHLLRLVNDTLDLARIEAGRLELMEQRFDLNQLVDEVYELMLPLAQRRGLEFTLQNRLGGRVVAEGDPVRLRQILLNLLGNAIKFTSYGSVVLRIDGLEGDGGLRFDIEDTGPGISAEQQKRLFLRFEQAEGAKTAARYGGSGLGLAICRELSLAMNGRITVDSEPGKGSRFTVELPIPWKAQSVEQVAGADSPAGAGRQLPALRILLVEDDPTVAEVIIGLLSGAGHQVAHAAHGLAALTEVASAPVDVAMLDLDLPGLDGLALAQQLRVLGYEMPLIAVTARSDAEAESQAMMAGFDGFLRKPVTTDMLLEMIASVLPAGFIPSS